MAVLSRHLHRSGIDSRTICTFHNRFIVSQKGREGNFFFSRKRLFSSESIEPYFPACIISLLFHFPILANYLNSPSPTSVTAVPPTVEAIPSALSDSYPDLLKRHYSFLNLQVPVIDSMLLHPAYFLLPLDFHLSIALLSFQTKRHSTYLLH